MAGITAAQADEQLALWLAASTAVAAGQSYSIAGRTLTRVDATEIRNMIDYWNAKATTLGNSASGRGRNRVIVPAG